MKTNEDTISVTMSKTVTLCWAGRLQYMIASLSYFINQHTHTHTHTTLPAAASIPTNVPDIPDGDIHQNTT